MRTIPARREIADMRGVRSGAAARVWRSRHSDGARSAVRGRAHAVGSASVHHG